MKIGVRKPSLKKSIKARTTGKLKRSVKRSVNPLYGKKGMGWVNDPKKAAYNKVYNRTTVGAGVGDFINETGVYQKGNSKIIWLILFFPVWFPFWFIYKFFKVIFMLISKLIKGIF